MTDGLESAIADQFPSRQIAMAVYRGSGKRWFTEIAEQLDCPTTEPKYNKAGEESGERNLTMDELKAEILHNVSDRILFILPEAKRLAAGVRYWLEECISKGATVVAIAVVNPGKDVFLEMLEIELELPSDRAIRDVMQDEARQLGLKLTDSRLSELQTMVGRNPMLARKIIRNEQLGLNDQANPEHSQYVNVAPLVSATLLSLGILRFVGMGTGDRGLYIVGGIALIVGMMMKQLGSIKGARRKVGQ